MQASKNYELFCKRKLNLHCHTLIFFMFIGSFTRTCLGLLETFSWCPCFFADLSGHSSTNRQNLAISNFLLVYTRYLGNRAISNFLSGPFRVRDSGTRLYCDPKTINHARLTGWYNKFKQSKTQKRLKKN